MAGLQEIGVLAIIVLAIVFLPRMTGRGRESEPAIKRIGMGRLSIPGRMRLAITVSIFYVLLATYYLEPWKKGNFPLFMLAGIGPVAAGWALKWVISGFKGKSSVKSSVKYESWERIAFPDRGGYCWPRKPFPPMPVMNMPQRA